jgi:N-acetylmuramoyl-L-alanine amidase
MKIRCLLIIIIISFLLAPCSSGKEQLKNVPEIRTDRNVESLPSVTKVPDENLTESILTEVSEADKGIIPSALQDDIDQFVLSKIGELKQRLITKGVPGEWFDGQLQYETFKIHSNIARYFEKSAEKKVDRDKRRDISWYFNRLGVHQKVAKGKAFIRDNENIFRRAEKKHGIHKELIAAIVGIETNFADRQRGNFHAFNSLVSQYIYTRRTTFAVREITALYEFSQKTACPLYYFTSSYAGAIGWGQFIPSSLQAFFIDANGVDDDMDPFSVEDTIFSVENYLYRHNLSEKNIDNYDGRYKAVFAYNHSDVYVQAVLFIYDALRNYFRITQPEVSNNILHVPAKKHPKIITWRGDLKAAPRLKISNKYSILNRRRPLRPRTRYIILHTTEGALEGSLRKVRRYGEAHYFVTPSGDVYRIIDRRKIATHAGRSMWEGRSTLDNYSIGIEVVGFHNRDISNAQYAALRELLRQLKSIYRINDKNVLTHSMVAYGCPNHFHKKRHRGRKRCGMIFAHPDVRRRLGLAAGPVSDPDVAARRLVVADEELYNFLYRPPVLLASLSDTGNVKDWGADRSEESGVIEEGVTAWRIAREKYDSPATIYTYPDGKRLRGNEIREWDNIPAGTRVMFSQEDPEQEIERFLEIGKDGNTFRDLAGNLCYDATTIYFFPRGLIRTGAEIKSKAFLRRLFSMPPKGTRVLVGYIYGGYVRKERTAVRIAGRKWNYPSTFYRLPEGRVISGDEIDDRHIPAGTLIFVMK